MYALTFDLNTQPMEDDKLIDNLKKGPLGAEEDVVRELDAMLESKCQAQIEALYRLSPGIEGFAATLAQDVNDLADKEDALVCKMYNVIHD